jgi:predicted nucleic acid-binding protein
MIGLDTSILVAHAIAEHPQHEASHRWLDAAVAGKLATSGTAANAAAAQRIRELVAGAGICAHTAVPAGAAR